MTVTTLTCSAKRKYHGMACSALAVWAVRADGHWHGACHQHPHQVLKRLASKGAKLTVQLAADAMAENERLRNLPKVYSRAEELLDLVRELVLKAPQAVSGRPEMWTAGRVRSTLITQEDELCDGETAWDMLESLCGEDILEHQGEGVYVRVTSPSA